MLGLGSKGFLRAGLITLLVVAGLALLAPSLLAQQAAPAGPPSTPESGYMRVLLAADTPACARRAASSHYCRRFC